ncbi:hypothetical protein BU26DRAFT_516461 [Trematosphaeria pertusa]|uniref:Pentatricopeptide repeat domain-containing protein n=1 Tax=Trematosphaeria pertusa TaxID=390896 RepID=A0A6A6IMQ8_9PLEO|nr:uncharacterized protein BU26DRAFT_516461 [Trematosphaeria pertusa]KAF2251676.1 hypothetical protein BU26DRAFT_516461 [Trematosphaeria pertusa]
MPTALDRLLARPSALDVLRSIVNASEHPPAWLSTRKCWPCIARRCQYSTAPEKPLPQIQRRWNQFQQPNRAHVLRRYRLTETGGERKDGIARQDEAAIWAWELQLQERRHRSGIRDVWRARHGYSLPVEDTPDAKFLWGTFIKDPKVVIAVIDHAADILKETGRAYPYLYELCMGYWLSQEQYVDLALVCHHRMLVKLKLRTLPLRPLARLGQSRFGPKALEAFIDIYRNSNERNVYDEVVPALCAKGNITAARRWHTLCVYRGDLPSPSIASHPIVQIFTAEMSTLSNPSPSFVGPSFGKPKLNEELTRRLLGRDTAPVRFEDSFCARMFATRAFPPESIIRGLAMVGVNEIGPQAVRAMASRTVPMSAISARFEQLRANGIALQGCVFSLALEKFVLEKQWHLVRSIMDSDQHPDVFDDAELQKKLLDFYLDQQDWSQAHRTLAILSLFHNDSSNQAWNLLLQAHIRRFNVHAATKVLQDMRTNDALITPESIVMFKGCLRRRQRGRKPTNNMGRRFDDLRYVTRVFTTILEGGTGYIPPHAWREIIRRFGMLGRFRELRRLIFWLLNWYAPRSGTKFAELPRSSFLDSATEKMRAAFPDRSHYFHFPAGVSQVNGLHPIRQLFPNSLQQGLIVWGFKAGLLPNAPREQSMFSPTAAKKHYRRRFLKKGILRPLDWSVGLKTLVELRDSGIHVHRHTVVKALQMMFVNLFGRGRSRRKENRAMERANIIPYAEYVHEVNKLWGSPLFREPGLFGKSRLHAMMWHPRLERRVHRRTVLRLSEIGGPNWRKSDEEKSSLPGHASSEGGSE